MPAPLLDARGRAFACLPPARRLVSLVPSQTELLADLGLDDAVVGLTRFCVRPEGWKARKVIVGGTKQVDVARIAALQPDLILANREENTAGMVAALEALAPVFVTDVKTLADALAMIRAVGRLTGVPSIAGDLARQIEAGFAALPPFPPCRAAYLIWREPFMVAGGDTFIHDMMARAGFVNAFGDVPRYPAVTLDDLRDRAVEAVLLSSEPYPFGPGHAVEVEKALPGVRVRLVDGEAFSWYGSRLLHTPGYFRLLRA